ncbi:hypothetical protein ACEU6E_05585 [Halorutilales archaeon Cl-col2-1]
MYDTHETQKNVSLLEQLLHGLRVGVGESRNEFAVCDSCGIRLREGSEVTVYAYSRADDSSWHTRGVYCRNCEKTQIETSTKNNEEAVAQSHIALLQDAKYQTASLVVVDPEVLDYSSEKEGVESQTVAVTEKGGGR